MRPTANDRLVLAAFGLLAISSLGLKAAAGPPRDGLEVNTADIDQRLVATLQRERFTTAEQMIPHRSTLIIGTRGGCLIGARDARDGTKSATVFARDAASIGPVRYLYRGRTYDQAPAFAMRLGRIETEVMSRLGASPQAPIPVALAASRQCRTENFGLADLRI